MGKNQECSTAQAARTAPQTWCTSDIRRGAQKLCVSKYPLADLAFLMKPVLIIQYKHKNACPIPLAFTPHPRESIPKPFRTPNPNKENADHGRRCAKGDRGVRVGRATLKD